MHRSLLRTVVRRGHLKRGCMFEVCVRLIVDRVALFSTVLHLQRNDNERAVGVTDDAYLSMGNDKFAGVVHVFLFIDIFISILGHFQMEF